MCRQMPYVRKSVFSYQYRNLLFFCTFGQNVAILDCLLDHLILNCMELLTSILKERLSSYHGGHSHWQICTQRNTCANQTDKNRHVSNGLLLSVCTVSALFIINSERILHWKKLNYYLRRLIVSFEDINYFFALYFQVYIYWSSNKNINYFP